jgi:hypothetical protein
MKKNVRAKIMIDCSEIQQPTPKTAGHQVPAKVPYWLQAEIEWKQDQTGQER